MYTYFARYVQTIYRTIVRSIQIERDRGGQPKKDRERERARGKEESFSYMQLRNSVEAFYTTNPAILSVLILYIDYVKRKNCVLIRLNISKYYVMKNGNRENLFPVCFLLGISVFGEYMFRYKWGGVEFGVCCLFQFFFRCKLVFRRP